MLHFDAKTAMIIHSELKVTIKIGNISKRLMISITGRFFIFTK
ncbi:hypothetical protein IMSAGC004_03404 [Bacteroidaceae bacterium]|nr:hypothetical protein IMSAGC004_03404 [Bacteroidaceae bacterium]